MYKVIKKFHDLQDGKKTKGGVVYHEYRVGDAFPRKGMNVSDDRIKELAGKDNKQGTPLIGLVKEKAEPKEEPKKAASAKSTAKKPETKVASK